MVASAHRYRLRPPRQPCNRGEPLILADHSALGRLGAIGFGWISPLPSSPFLALASFRRLSTAKIEFVVRRPSYAHPALPIVACHVSFSFQFLGHYSFRALVTAKTFLAPQNLLSPALKLLGH